MQMMPLSESTHVLETIPILEPKFEELKENLVSSVEIYHRLLSHHTKKTKESFTFDDLLLFVKHKALEYRQSSKINEFFQILKNASVTEDENILNLFAEENMLSKEYQVEMPLLRQNVNNLLQDFEFLSGYFNIIEEISEENGRPFASSCEKVFDYVFESSQIVTPYANLEPVSARVKKKKNLTAQVMEEEHDNLQKTKFVKFIWKETAQSVFGAVQDEISAKEYIPQKVLFF